MLPNLIRPASRVVQNGLANSKLWADLKPRTDDILIATYSKSGTTWMQRIVDLLVHQDAAPREFLAASPWLDATFFAPHEVNLAMLEAQTHRRFIKSHLPFDALPVYRGWKVIHVARDGRDACFSMHNHQLGFNPEIRARIAGQKTNDVGQLPPVSEDPRTYYLGWIEGAEKHAGGEPGGDLPYFEFEMTYWRERHEPYLLLVHYNDLKRDLKGEMRRISDFLGIETPPARLRELAEAASFDVMKRDGDKMMPQLKMAFDRGADRFIHKGTNGRWRDVLTAEDIARYERLLATRVSKPCGAWLEKGRLVAGDPREAAG